MSVDPYPLQPQQQPHPRGFYSPFTGQPRSPRTVALAVTMAAALFMTVLAPNPASGHSANGDTQDPAAQEGDTGQADDGNTVIPEIVFPVVGPVTYSDTWGACRGAGCSRSHKGVDIFGHKLAPLVAAADGVITADRRSGMTISGNTVIIRGDDGWRYLYIHVNNDSPGTDDGANPQGWIIPNRLRVGDRVKAGDVIAYLGDSGNAETTPAHVHFEIHEPNVGAVNPAPFVDDARQDGRVVPVSSLASTPEGRAEYGPVVAAWYRALLKRDPTDEELFAWTDRMDIGFGTLDDLIADLTMSKARRDPAGAVVRSFKVSLNRLPTLNELRQWEEQYRNGSDLEDITKILIESGPFISAHGDLTDEQFVRVIYRNAIGQDPTAARLEDWLTLFSEGSPRETLTAYFADSYSVKNSTWHTLEVVQAYRASLDRLPNGEELGLWVGHLNAGGLIPDVVAGIRLPEDDGAEEVAEDDAGDDAEDGVDGTEQDGAEPAAPGTEEPATEEPATEEPDTEAPADGNTSTEDIASGDAGETDGDADETDGTATASADADGAVDTGSNEAAGASVIGQQAETRQDPDQP